MQTTTAKPEQGDLKLDVWSDQNTKNSVLFIMISLSFSLLIWLRLITRNHQPLFFMMVLLVAYAYGVLVRRYDYEVPTSTVTTNFLHFCTLKITAEENSS